MDMNDPAKIRFLPHSRKASTLTVLNSDSSRFSLSNLEAAIDPLTARLSHPCQPEDHRLDKEHSRLVIQITKTLREREISKHEKIRIRAWLQKLSAKQQNPVWKKNVVFYLQVLEQMIGTLSIGSPFSALPPEGQLPKLTIYDLPYPLRQMFSCSKERSQTSRSKPKQSKDLLNNISRLKGHDFTESCRMDKKTAKGPSSKPIVYFKLQQDEFRESQISTVAMKPVYSNNKARKEHIQKSNSNRISGGKYAKEQAGRAARNKIAVERQNDKENDPNAANISRQLFHSKGKTQHNETLESQGGKNQQIYLQEKRNVWSQQSQSQQGSFGSIFQQQKQESAAVSQMYRLLLDNKSSLSSHSQYPQLVSNIQQMGKKLSLPEFQEDLDSSVLSERSLAFLKASQQLKCKFQETDNETVEFMQFLHKIKGKDRHSLRSK